MTGISASDEMDSHELPPQLEATVRDLVNGKKAPLAKGLKRSKGAADFLNYRITLTDGKKVCVIQCTDIGMDTRMKSLVSYVQNNSSK